MYTWTTLGPFCLVLLKIFCLNAGSLPANHLPIQRTSGAVCWCRMEIHTSSFQVQQLPRVLLGNRFAGGIALIVVSFKYHHKRNPA